MNERAIPRYGNSILFKNCIVGKVTSGTMSPSLKRGICMGYVDSKFLLKVMPFQLIFVVKIKRV